MPFFPHIRKRKGISEREEIADAAKSLYYWWWRYLRLSVDYWWLCHEKGKTKCPEFAKVYQDFGNVFQRYGDFDTWWMAKGRRIFAYPLTLPKVSKAADLTREMSWRRRGWYEAIVVPVFYNKARLINEFKALIKDHVPTPRPRELNALRAFAPLRGIKPEVIELMFMTWCVNDAIDRGTANGMLSNPHRYTQYWIGKKLGLSKAKANARPLSQSEAARENSAVRTKVNHYITNANALIKNVELGIFPSVKAPPTLQYWTKAQAKAMDEAIAAGKWVSPESSTPEVIRKIGLSTLDASRLRS